LSKPNVVRSIYDPTAGTGGMLSVAEDHIRQMNPTATLTLAGQEINPQSYAICKADMTVKGQSVDAIVFGDTLLNDGHAGSTFNYCLSNPPFGVDWKKQQKAVTEEHKLRGYAGRFGPGLPRVSDGSMLFLLHLINKLRPAEDGGAGGRAGIVLNGSPLFTGGAGSGESNIRKWILERDLLEAIIALPSDMFYNTGIATYIWILATKKSPDRIGKVQLIDGSKMFRKMRKGLGSKRNELGHDDIAEIVRLYGSFEDAGKSKIFANEDFFYRTITVERPLRLRWAPTVDRANELYETKSAKKVIETFGFDALSKIMHRVTPWYLERVDSLGADRAAWMSRVEFLGIFKRAASDAGVRLPTTTISALVDDLADHDDAAEVVTDAKGGPVANTSLRDTENVPWNEDVHAYFDREVKPFAPDAWINESKTKEGCEIPFTRHFYDYVPPRSLEEIDADLEAVLGRIRERLEQVKA
jgi:type I restriction enzyme M protein